MSDIDYLCTACGGFGFLYSRPRWCPFCAIRIDGNTTEQLPEEPRKQRGVKRVRVDHEQDDKDRTKRHLEFNKSKRELDKKIMTQVSDLSMSEYDALIRSWVNIQ